MGCGGFKKKLSLVDTYWLTFAESPSVVELLLAFQSNQKPPPSNVMCAVWMAGKK